MTDDLQLILEVTKVYRPIAKSVASKALKGNISAAAEAANRAEGTPRQRPEESEERNREIIIRVIEDNPTERVKLNAEQAADLLPPDGDSGPESLAASGYRLIEGRLRADLGFLLLQTVGPASGPVCFETNPRSNPGVEVSLVPLLSECSEGSLGLAESDKRTA